MIRFLYGSQLKWLPRLRNTMHQDRADQFKRRLGWEVTVSDDGEERDEYDKNDPLYVIWQKQDGTHGGSMRLMPTTGQCMINDHFLHIIGNRPIKDPKIWECSRFCLNRKVKPGTASTLMLAGGEVMRQLDLHHLVGIFDARMERVYRKVGATPEILGTQGFGRDKVSAGLWKNTLASQKNVERKSEVTIDAITRWFETDSNRTSFRDAA